MKTIGFAVVVAGCSVLAAAPCRAQRAQPKVTVIAGTLLGASGAPMKLAQVFIWQGVASREATRALVGPDGRFAIAAPSAGPVTVEFTGVDHNAAIVPLMVDRPQTIGLDVRLRHYEYTDSLDRVTAIGDWNHFGFGSGKPLVKQPDGRYTLDVETTADTLAYQLLGLTREQGHSINGPQAGHYAYDNGGDYRNVIRAAGGHATITLDPATLRSVPGELRITFRDSATQVARTWHLVHVWSVVEDAYFDSSRAARVRHDSLHFDLTPSLRRLRAALAAEKVPLLRQLLLFQLLQASSLADRPDTVVARRVIAEVPASSPWFQLDPNALNSMYRAFAVAYGTTGPRHQLSDSAQRGLLERFERVAASQPDSEVQAQALQSAVFLAKNLHDDQRFNTDYMALVTGHPGSSATRIVQSQLAPNRPLRAGVPMPEFRFAGLEDSAVVYTPGSFAGKPYVLDFWATSCGPCVYDMKWLHAARDSLAAMGVQLLSISLDASPQDVTRFRAGEWKMPWPQAFAPGAFENPDIKRLEILAIPTMVVVGGDGVIRAVELGMRGEQLLPGLRQALETRPTP